MFVKNAWYVAAWADELGTAPLARRICDEPIVLFRDAARPRGGSGRLLLPPRRAAERGQDRREPGSQCGYHGMVYGGDGACVQHSRPSAHPGEGARTQLPARRERRDAVDLDGRPAGGRSRRDRRLSLSQRHRELAAQAHDVRDRRQRDADGRQPDGSHASRVRPYHDDRRQPQVPCRGDHGHAADRDGLEIHALDARYPCRRRPTAKARRSWPTGSIAGKNSSSSHRRRAAVRRRYRCEYRRLRSR